ncbi:hypothetical protein DL764_007415 [Monosporascus ibericus]|uniref:Aquaporin n=1 Tax=Monosporascus ibericus TaxID=155417 RepID=A0A4Q4T337_9PEZI|nr:hypothetical protein DL764_007415 [Monosporascus ibericus]
MSHPQHDSDSGDVVDMPLSSPDGVSNCAPKASESRYSSQDMLREKQERPERPQCQRKGPSERTDRQMGKPKPKPRSLPSKPPMPVVLEGWVDDDYYAENPWYGQAKTKPIFSLGRPLPRISRRAKKPQKAEAEIPEDLAEAGQGGLEPVESRNIRKQRTKSSTKSGKCRMTNAGAAHNQKRNDGGQPIFDYVPYDNSDGDGEGYEDVSEDEADDDRHNKPKFGIDSEPLGKREDDKAEEGKQNPDELRNWWARIRAKHPEPLAEFLATGVAVFLGLSATLSVNLTAQQRTQYGSYETTCWAWGFAWMLGIYLGGGVSGAHMNPAVSISLSIFRGFPWKSCLVYVVVQFTASIVAGALAWGIYKDTIQYMDPTMENTSKSFFSAPQPEVSLGTALLNQLVGGAIMVIAVFALGDDQNNPPGAGMHAFVIGLLVCMLRFSVGYTVGSALNPASDFGPRVVAYAVGYRQPNVFQDMWWLYGPWLATLAGSIIGCAIYDSFVFIGTESPINYRVPEKFRKRTSKFLCGLGSK